MPTYDYVCAACDHAFEHFQSMTSRRLRKCPACGKPKLDRLVGSGAGVIFKGSGFYETDYKRAGGGKPAAGETTPETKGDAGATKKDAPSKDAPSKDASSSASGDSKD